MTTVRRTRLDRRYAMLAAAAVLSLSLGSQARGAETLAEAARRREDAARSVAVEFEIKEFVAKGQLQKSPDPAAKAGSGSGAYPAADTEAKSRNRWVVSGRMARFENNHPLWSDSDGTLLPTTTLIVTNGDLAKTYFPTGISGRTTGRGIIWTDGAGAGLRDQVLTPLNTHFRGLTAGLAPYPVGNLTRTGATLPVGGRTCHEYAAPADPNKSISLFLDEADGFLLRRLRKLNRGHLHHQTDVTYAPRDGDNVPDRWTLSEFGTDGKVKSKREVSVVGLTVNPEVAGDQFDIQYPAGVAVFDQRNRTEYTVLPDGRMREVREDGGDPAEVAQPGASWLTRWQPTLLWAVPAVAAMAVLAAVVRRAARQRRSV